LPLAALSVFQGWMTIGLFGGADAWDALSDSRPIVSGRHALHLYEGYLGAKRYREEQQTLTWDPAYSAGYPKTPWFDAGSKPAELFLSVTGGSYRPEAYKWGLALSVGLIPLLLAMSARSAGLNHGGSFLAAFVGLVVFWSDFGRARLWAGDLDLLLASCLAVMFCAQLLAFHSQPGLGAWLSLIVGCWLLCFLQPLMLLTLAPAILLYYFGGGLQHRMFWHFFLFLAFAIGIGGNYPWLRDALRFWWIQTDQPATGPELTSLQALLDTIQYSPLFSDGLHRGLAITLLAGSVLGLLALKQTMAPRTLGAAMVGYLALAIFGGSWGPLARLEPARFIFPGLLLAAIPMVQGLQSAIEGLGRLMGSTLRGAGIVCVLLLAAGVALLPHLTILADRCTRMERLPLGLPPPVLRTVETLQRQTTMQARILFEESRDTDAWSPLLAVLSERMYVGGLGSEAMIEHAALRLAHGHLAGRPLDEWSDAELGDYCRRFNIGWVVCRTPSALRRFRAWPLVAATAPLPDGSTFLRLNRGGSFFLAGQGTVLRCDSQCLALADLVPVDGHIVLSFHHRPGMVASTDRVRVEKEPQPWSAIPFIRLRVPGPMSRLTLYWQE
jgi:hypothetical protein